MKNTMILNKMGSNAFPPVRNALDRKNTNVKSAMSLLNYTRTAHVITKRLLTKKIGLLFKKLI